VTPSGSARERFFALPPDAPREEYFAALRAATAVRLGVDIVRAEDRAELVRRVFERAVAPGGRLIVCHYRNEGEVPLIVSEWLSSLGERVVGARRAPGVEIAWLDRPAHANE
jgi:hypothetical protein